MKNHLETIQQFINAFNKGDIEGMAAVFADPCSILDGLPPHTWLGPNAIRDWYSDVIADAKHLGASGYVVTVENPLHNEINGDSAYVVLPASIMVRIDGQQHIQSGAIFTVALHQFSEGWRIAAWAWAKGKIM